MRSLTSTVYCLHQFASLPSLGSQQDRDDLYGYTAAPTMHSYNTSHTHTSTHSYKKKENEIGMIKYKRGRRDIENNGKIIFTIIDYKFNEYAAP